MSKTRLLHLKIVLQKADNLSNTTEKEHKISSLKKQKRVADMNDQLESARVEGQKLKNKLKFQGIFFPRKIAFSFSLIYISPRKTIF